MGRKTSLFQTFIMQLGSWFYPTTVSLQSRPQVGLQQCRRENYASTRLTVNWISNLIRWFSTTGSRIGNLLKIPKSVFQENFPWSTMSKTMGSPSFISETTTHRPLMGSKLPMQVTFIQFRVESKPRNSTKVEKEYRIMIFRWGMTEAFSSGGC